MAAAPFHLAAEGQQPVRAAVGRRLRDEAAAAGDAHDEALVGQALHGLAQVGRYLGIGIANLVTLVTPDRIVIGGGVAAAGELLFEPIRAELRLRVRTTSLDGVTIVAAELGTWAGAIGAAVHGAEQAAAASGAAA